jgi:hypothetical protein
MIELCYSYIYSVLYLNEILVLFNLFNEFLLMENYEDTFPYLFLICF